MYVHCMKINQLFKSRVDTDTLLRLLKCFGLNDLNDKMLFSKLDIVKLNTVNLIKIELHLLEPYYLPCKALIYLRCLTEKKAITVLKQVLRLHGHFLISIEKNQNNRKIIYYQLMNDKDMKKIPRIKTFNITNIITFD